MTIGTSSTLSDNRFNSASISLRSLLPGKYSKNKNFKCFKLTRQMVYFNLNYLVINFLSINNKINIKNCNNNIHRHH